MKSREYRANVLTSYGANATEIEELLIYNENVFDHSRLHCSLKLPLSSEAHVDTWENYVIQGQEIGVFPTLRSKLVQLRFPIQEGISQTEIYKAATRKGKLVNDTAQLTGLQLKEPEKLELTIYQSLAGAIPVIIAGNRADFVSLVQAITMRNEPKEVAASMGACMVGGYNNWDRIRQYRQQWQNNHPESAEADWSAEFKRIIPQKELYQDRFIILSQGNYSNVSAAHVGLTDAQWQKISLTIRLEHECTHYFTKRVFGSMHNNLLDEFIADYRGITSAAGYYRDDWFLNFMGLESFPDYRRGGRLENYQGGLSDNSFRILRSLVVNAAKNLKSFESTHKNSINLDMMLVTLSRMTLEELAANESQGDILDIYTKVSDCF
ncbi:MAG: hypothetical protein AAF378_09715 [Cyanobacteria bacterium P01_A01_bin.84]